MKNQKNSNKLFNAIKAAVLFLSLLYLTFYIPMTFIVYSTQWTKANCNWHPRCKFIGYERAYRGIDELSSHFRHGGELVHLWSNKEKLHLKEVRMIFDKMFFIGFLAVFSLILTFDRKRASRYALINAIIIFSLLVILPFFATFWRDVFHPLLFSNKLWLNNKYDLSFYIMPRQFFKYTVTLLILSCSIINLSIWLALGKKFNE